MSRDTCRSCIAGEEAYEIQVGEGFQAAFGDCRACAGSGFQREALLTKINAGLREVAGSKVRLQAIGERLHMMMAVNAMEREFGKRKVSV